MNRALVGPAANDLHRFFQHLSPQKRLALATLAKGHYGVVHQRNMLERHLGNLIRIRVFYYPLVGGLTGARRLKLNPTHAGRVAALAGWKRRFKAAQEVVLGRTATIFQCAFFELSYHSIIGTLDTTFANLVRNLIQIKGPRILAC